MSDSPASFKNSGYNKKLFILSIIIILYWLTAKSLNVYSDAFLGAFLSFYGFP
jgi:hypothetical protein